MRAIIISIIFCGFLIGEDAMLGNDKLIYLWHNPASNALDFMAVELRDGNIDPGKIVKVNSLRMCRLEPNPAERYGADLFKAGQFKDLFYTITGNVEFDKEKQILKIAANESSFEKVDLVTADILNEAVRFYNKNGK